jgi:predicted Zn-dependent protease
MKRWAMVEKRVARAVRQIGVALLAGTLGAGVLQAQTREGVQVGETSVFAKIVPADQIEREANLQYQQALAQASKQHALGPADNAQVQRLRAIMDRIIPFTGQWNPRAQQWKWEVNLIGSNQINAYCMPGGKIAFYTGILNKLQLTDDEVAMVMGHEIAHALREHARERMGKGRATDFAARVGGSLAASLFGIDPRITDALAQTGASLATLKFGREDESEADLVGMELAARAGYDPRAGVSLWQKMAANNKGAPPEWLSTHPSGNSRIAEIEANLPKVTSLYDRAKKPAASEASSQ